MQPRQMRETCRPVLPSLAYSIWAPWFSGGLDESQKPAPSNPEGAAPGCGTWLTRAARNGCATGLRSTPKVVSCTLSIRGLGSRRGYIGFLWEGAGKGDG